MRTNLSKALTTAVMVGGALTALPARAHISIIGDLQSRGGDQKSIPCDGNTRGSGSIYTFEPGETITINVSEDIPHPGYFRISFDVDGTDDFKDPVSIMPIETSRANQGPTDHDKGSDFCSNDSVLMDNVDPHTAGLFDTWTWQVKLPDVECDKCTIQVLQIMEDPLGHGAFDGDSDIYHRCIDVTLKAPSGTTPSGAFPECTVGERFMGQTRDDAGTPGSSKDAGTAHDAGSALDSGVRPQDASADPQDSGKEPEVDGPNGSGGMSDASTGKTDAGVKDAGGKKDAAVTKDAATSDDDDESDDDEGDDDDNQDKKSSGDDGCSVGSTNGFGSYAWFFVVVGIVAIRTRRTTRRSRRLRHVV